MSENPPHWDWRWPDPVALKVAAERILQSRDPDDPTLNRRLSIRIQMDIPDSDGIPVRALMVTPWAVERIYWNSSTQHKPPIRHAFPLTADAQGRVAAGQGVILEFADTLVPVLTAWEPELGHHWVETLLPSVLGIHSVEEAVALALGKKPLSPPKRSVSDHLSLSVSRRKLLGIFR
ncbi:MAG: hypothetical protein HQL80_01170 [Magnetococcales bacterium]|nr:hypothetical protein [Magnetococcales bacterium]